MRAPEGVQGRTPAGRVSPVAVGPPGLLRQSQVTFLAGNYRGEVLSKMLALSHHSIRTSVLHACLRRYCSPTLARGDVYFPTLTVRGQLVLFIPPLNLNLAANI